MDKIPFLSLSEQVAFFSATDWASGFAHCPAVSSGQVEVTVNSSSIRTDGGPALVSGQLVVPPRRPAAASGQQSSPLAQTGVVQ